VHVQFLLLLNHSAGRERSGTVGYCAGRDGIGFQFDCNSRERDGNGFISTGRDGTGYNTIQYNTTICNAHKVEHKTSNLRRGFIPVSLSNGHQSQDC